MRNWSRRAKRRHVKKYGRPRIAEARRKPKYNRNVPALRNFAISPTNSLSNRARTDQSALSSG
jgi:hypothetical protein